MTGFMACSHAIVIICFKKKKKKKKFVKFTFFWFGDMIMLLSGPVKAINNLDFFLLFRPIFHSLFLKTLGEGLLERSSSILN